jgi:hypothetical protein
VLYGGGLFFLAAMALWIYCIFDVVSTDESLTRNLPKLVWLLLVVFVPTVGSIAWLILGRPANAGFAGRDTNNRPIAKPRSVQRALGPDDDPRFMSHLDERRRRLDDWEQDLKRREDELKRGKDDEGA